MKLTLSALLLLICFGLNAQQYLYLQKGNDVPHTRLSLQDKVTFKTEGSDAWTKGPLQEITAESITVGGVSYPLKEIVAFRTNNDLVYFLGTAGIAGGLLFSGIILVNGLIAGSSPIISGNQVILGSSLVAGGFLVRWLSRKTYQKEKGWQWNVIDLEKDFNQQP